MRVMCISDIHGGIDNLKNIIERYKEEKCEKLLILGDFSGYYHLSTDFEVAEILNNMAGSIIAVKGNCDSSYIEEILNFGLGFLKTIDINKMKVTLTHGHIYNGYNLPENCGDIFLFGHTHVGMLEKIDNRIIANPGSISKPRCGTNKSYIVIDEENICLKKLSGDLIKKIELNNK